ncbi:MAG: hypothetical protein IPK87_03215 [Planctomycetes bacterium]|nr:hypothetical protein [Planctomycetota bacterium]
MSQVWEWIQNNALAIVSGVVLLMVAAAIYVVVAKTDKNHKIQTDSQDPGGDD